jgi:hypothetical protein
VTGAVRAEHVVPPLVALAAALVAWPAASATVTDRIRRVTPRASGAGRRPARRPARAGPPSEARRWLLAAAAGAAVAVLVGGTWGVAAGIAAAVAGRRWLGRGGGSTARDEAGILAELPVACDLLAVCLEAGVPPGAALSAVGGAVAEPLRASLREVAGRYRLGADPSGAWAGSPAALQGLARAMVRAGASGSTVVPALRSLAAELRTSSRSRTDAAVRRAGVWVLAPLGACFLPAFVCLGVVPLVLGIARGVFG